MYIITTECTEMSAVVDGRDSGEDWVVLRCIKGMELASLERVRKTIAKTSLIDDQDLVDRTQRAEKETMKVREEEPDKLADQEATLKESFLEAVNEGIKLREEETEREGCGCGRVLSLLFCRCRH